MTMYRRSVETGNWVVQDMIRRKAGAELQATFDAIDLQPV